VINNFKAVGRGPFKEYTGLRLERLRNITIHVCHCSREKNVCFEWQE